MTDVQDTDTEDMSDDWAAAMSEQAESEEAESQPVATTDSAAADADPAEFQNLQDDALPQSVEAVARARGASNGFRPGREPSVG